MAKKVLKFGGTSVGSIKRILHAAKIVKKEQNSILLMKIWITSFEIDGKKFAGPNIIAEDEEHAEFIAKHQGLTVEGILELVMDNEFTFEDLSKHNTKNDFTLGSWRPLDTGV